MRLARWSVQSLVLLLLCLSAVAWSQTARWPETRANQWYAQQAWLVGTNYVPKSAINQLEMWQADTFDLKEVDLEFSWAEAMGMNTMRVFLHDLLWQQDATGFQKRIDAFLPIAARHHILHYWCCSIPAGIRGRVSDDNTSRGRDYTTRDGYRARERRRCAMRDSIPG